MVGNSQRFAEVILVEVAIVLAVKLAELGAECGVKIAPFFANAVEQILQRAVPADSAVFADAHKDHAVDQSLHGLGEPGRAVERISFRKILFPVIQVQVRQQFCLLA